MREMITREPPGVARRSGPFAAVESIRDGRDDSIAPASDTSPEMQAAQLERYRQMSVERKRELATKAWGPLPEDSAS
jgi:hypothetical protein